MYGKWNTGKSELSLNYSFGYRDFKGIRTEETAHYHLNDGSIYTIQRNDLASRNRSLSNQMKLTYNLADSSRYVFQASLSGDFSHVPGDFSQKQILDGTQTYTALEQQQSQSSSPVLDLYYFQQFTPRSRLPSMPWAHTSAPNPPTVTTKVRLTVTMWTDAPTPC